MSQLAKVLAYFERDDVDEVRLQSGAPVMVNQAGCMRPLTRQAVTAPQVRELIRGTVLEPMVPASDTSGSPQIVEIEGHEYVVIIARHGELLQFRFGRVPRPSAAPRTEQAASSSGPVAIGRVGAAAAARPTAAVSAPTSAPAPARAPAVTPSERPAAHARPSAAPAPADLSAVLSLGRSLQASDVHVVAERPVAYRVAGLLRPRGEPLTAAQVRAMLEPILPERAAAQLARLGYCDFALEVPGAGRLRVNVGRQRTGLKGCFRLVAPRPQSLEQLGLPTELSRVTRYHQGLAIVSGPNGQGKTTTMAALVDLINGSRPVHIITVEDPVEVLHPVKSAVVTQREVGAHTRSFASALAAALREDPDVIVIGELRDRETVEMALAAAETGHLVIATMSTPSGAKTITRLIDMFPPEDQAQVRATLAGALKIVVSQRLVPRADGAGLVAAAELITGNVPLWSLIRDDKLFQLPSLLQRGRAYGMIRIDESLAELVARGLITEEAARYYADDPRGLASPSPDPSPGQAAPGDNPAEPRRGGLRNLFGGRGS